MGVLNCDRGNCGSLLVERYSDNYGCICKECFEELINSNLTNIGIFMNSPRGSFSDYKISTRTRLERIFKKL